MGLLWEGVTSEALSSHGKPSRGWQVGKQASFLTGTQGAPHRTTTLVKREADHLPRITSTGAVSLKSSIIHTCTLQQRVDV